MTFSGLAQFSNDQQHGSNRQTFPMRNSGRFSYRLAYQHRYVENWVNYTTTLNESLFIFVCHVDKNVSAQTYTICFAVRETGSNLRGQSSRTHVCACTRHRKELETVSFLAYGRGQCSYSQLYCRGPCGCSQFKPRSHTQHPRS